MSSDQMDGILIAETSDTGEVAWVWVVKNGERVPRPFHRRDAGLPLERFKIAGAPRDKIASWLGASAFA